MIKIFSSQWCLNPDKNHNITCLFSRQAGTWNLDRISSYPTLPSFIWFWTMHVKFQKYLVTCSDYLNISPYFEIRIMKIELKLQLNHKLKIYRNKTFNKKILRKNENLYSGSDLPTTKHASQDIKFLFQEQHFCLYDITLHYSRDCSVYFKKNYKCFLKWCIHANLKWPEEKHCICIHSII